jgi:hypothetical protein
VHYLCTGDKCRHQLRTVLNIVCVHFSVTLLFVHLFLAPFPVIYAVVPEFRLPGVRGPGGGVHG